MMKLKMPSERTRAYAYNVLLAAVPLLGAYGLLDKNTAALWVALGGSFLGHGLARVNVTTKR